MRAILRRMGPLLGLLALLVGIGLGTAFPERLLWVGTGVRAGVLGLAKAAPYVIWFTLTPAVMSMLRTGSAARFAGWVLAAFLAMTVIAGVLATIVLVPLFQLPLRPMEGELGEVLAAIGVQTVVLARHSPAFIAIWYGTIVALGLHFGRKVAWAEWFCRPTADVITKVGVDGVALLGRVVKVLFPFILLAIGVYLPTGIESGLRAGEQTLADAGGLDILGRLGPAGWYFLSLLVLVVILAVMLATYIALVCWYTRFPVKRFMKDYFLYVYPFAWATASSAATIPINLERAKEALGVRAEVRDFVIPLGATINLAGTMVGAFVVTTVAATLVGYQPTAIDLLVLLLPLTLVAVGVPGIPGGLAAVAPPIILGILPIPLEAHAAFAAVFVAFGIGLSDQFRTGVNSVDNGILSLLFEHLYDKNFARGAPALPDVAMAVPLAAATADGHEPPAREPSRGD